MLEELASEVSRLRALGVRRLDACPLLEAVVPVVLVLADIEGEALDDEDVGAEAGSELSDATHHRSDGLQLPGERRRVVGIGLW